MVTNSALGTAAKWPKKQLLETCFYPSQPVFQGPFLASFHEAIKTKLPQWSAELSVSEDDYSKNWVFVGRDGSLHDAIQEKTPPKNTKNALGSIVLRGSTKGLRFYLLSCKEPILSEFNFFSAQIHGVTSIESRAPVDWTREFFEEIVATLPIRYARGHVSAEFGAKNLISDKGGVRAVGVNLRKSLPGLFWLNYFGAAYVGLIGAESLLSAPAHEVKKVGSGVLIDLDFTPLTWQTTAYLDREKKVLKHLGPQYFFSKEELDRILIAPDFLPV